MKKQSKEKKREAPQIELMKNDSKDEKLALMSNAYIQRKKGGLK